MDLPCDDALDEFFFVLSSLWARFCVFKRFFSSFSPLFYFFRVSKKRKKRRGEKGRI